MRKHWILLACLVVVMLGAMFLADDVAAYEKYHVNGNDTTGNCATCHGDFRGSGDNLHSVHVSQFTGNCSLCHTGSSFENPFIMWSEGNGYGCVGCHGRDYSETIEANYDNGDGEFPLTDLPKMSGYGLRRLHLDIGVTQCLDCHGEVLPYPEGPPALAVTQPPYYARADVSITDTCNSDGTEDSTCTRAQWETTLLGLDNDGDGLYDGDDEDCQAGPVCGDGTLDTGEDCDDGNTDPGDCCAADCTFETAGSSCGDPSTDQCDNADSCDGAGACDANWVPGGTSCDDSAVLHDRRGLRRWRKLRWWFSEYLC